MRRDWEVIRHIVLTLADAPPGQDPKYDFEGLTPEEIAYHLYLVYKEGLAEGQRFEQGGGRPPSALLERLTWAGNDFADAMRDETIWRRAMSRIKEKGGAVTLEMLKSLLFGYVRKELGLGG
jgi:hypothetical protein